MKNEKVWYFDERMLRNDSLMKEKEELMRMRVRGRRRKLRNSRRKEEVDEGRKVTALIIAIKEPSS